MLPVKVRRVVLARHRVDFRKGADGLLGEAYRLGADPYMGDCVLFVKRDHTQLRALVGDGVGLYLVTRRFEGGRLRFLQSFAERPAGEGITTGELSLLLEGAAAASEELGDATVVKTLDDKRVRYDIKISVSRIELDVEKQVVVKENGERTVVSATTDGYGPARYQVTWSALATPAIPVGQFAMPLNRLATLFSCVGKRFTAGGLSRLLHYVAERLVAIYLELGDELSDSEILGGDDTSCRVLEVSSYFEKQKEAGGGPKEHKPPWAKYRTSAVCEESNKRCEEQKRARMERRATGDREAKRTPDEDPTLGMLIGRYHDLGQRFENIEGQLEERGLEGLASSTLGTGASSVDCETAYISRKRR
jgi:hypothetical protein